MGLNTCGALIETGLSTGDSSQNRATRVDEVFSDVEQLVTNIAGEAVDGALRETKREKFRDLQRFFLKVVSWCGHRSGGLLAVRGRSHRYGDSGFNFLIF